MDISPPSLSTLKDCDNLLAKYEPTGPSQHTAFVIQIKRRRNALLAIARLPRELRHQVFHLSLPHRRLGKADYWEYPRRQGPTGLAFRYYLALLTIRRVSYDWEQEICDTPSFWTVMSPLFSNALRDLIWRRSSNMALDAEVTRNGYSHWSSGIQTWTEEETAYLEQVAERGMQELYMEVPRGADPSPYINNIHHPRLSKLYISHQDRLNFSSPLVAPQLTDLHLVNCSFPWDGLAKLRSLILHGTSCPTLAQLIQTLSTSPFLEELQLTSLREDPSNPLPGDDVLQEPLNMAYLTVLLLERVPCRLTAGLLDRLVTSSNCRSSVDVNVEGYPRVPALCQQVGRLCRSVGTASKKLKPSLNINPTSFSVGMGGKTLLSLQNHGSEEEPGPGRSWNSQLLRFFLAEVEGPSFKDSINESFVWCSSLQSTFDGIEIMDDFFPNMCRLNVAVDAGLEGVVRALAEIEGATGDSPQWRLQKLSDLEIKLYGHADTYDGLIDVAIKRTQAAALPQSTVSPIKKLTLGHGSVQPESLCRLDELGIECILRYVTILPPKTGGSPIHQYNSDYLL